MTAAMAAWSLDQARKTYSIPHWSEGYFEVDEGGHVVARPRGVEGPSIAVAQVVHEVRANGPQLPPLVVGPGIPGPPRSHLPVAFGQDQ